MMVAADEVEGEESATASATHGRRGKRNRIHERNWGYTTYLDRVFGLRCFGDLVRLQVYPDAKDISESYGALQAALRYGTAGCRRDERCQHTILPRDCERPAK